MITANTENEGPVAELVLAYGQYILAYPQFKLEIRGKYPEWVFAAATEILTNLSRMSDANDLDLARYAHDEEDDPIEVEMNVEFRRYQLETRYESIPQCGVTYDGEDYRWIAEPGRHDAHEPVMERIINPGMKARARGADDDAQLAEPAPTKAPAMAGAGPGDFDMEAEMAKLDNIPGLDD